MRMRVHTDSFVDGFLKLAASTVGSSATTVGVSSSTAGVKPPKPAKPKAKTPQVYAQPTPPTETTNPGPAAAQKAAPPPPVM